MVHFVWKQEFLDLTILYLPFVCININVLPGFTTTVSRLIVWSMVSTAAKCITILFHTVPAVERRMILNSNVFMIITIYK